jgi:predicted ferric reductase/Ca2+-binding EF-hand superfamily protein
VTEQQASQVDRHLLAMLERAFAHHAGADARIDLAELRQALGLRSEYLARRVLGAFDRDHDGTIDRGEFLEGVRKLVFGTEREKLLFAFRVHDHDGDGRISQEELLRMITISLGESDVVRATQPPEHLTRALFVAADENRDGFIGFDELEAEVRKHPRLVEKMTRSEAMWIAPNEDLLAWLDARAGRAAPAPPTAALGWLPAVFVVLWVIANGAVFAQAMLSGAASAPDPAAQVGRALGRCAALDGALILVPMMRRLLTRARASWLGKVVPIDDAIDFHRLAGHTLFGLSIAHTAAFVVAFGRGHAGSILAVAAHARGATGFALLGVLAVMWLFSLSFVRRSRRFELFYFTHLLYVVWLVLAVVHAPSFLFWAGVPLLGFGVEQVLRLARRAPATPVLAADALRSGVVRLELAKPAGFDFAAGDYVFVRLPAIARHEWHPFTVSSAPERETLTLHVRSLGNWTAALRRLAERGSQGGVAFVDGPYGSPSAHIFEAENAVLIGAGIGVTPFASVLESLVLRGNGESARPSELCKVHFFWVNRDQYSFEWFRDLLLRLEQQDRERLLDVHLCMDGRGAGVTALGVELAREVMHSGGRSDILTGLHWHTHVGPPNWGTMLAEVAAWHRGERVDVFFCGPPGLAAKLRPICERLGMTFREERF